MSYDPYGTVGGTVVGHKTLMLHWIPSNKVDLILATVLSAEDVMAAWKTAQQGDVKIEGRLYLAVCGNLCKYPLVVVEPEETSRDDFAKYLLQVAPPCVINERRIEKDGAAASIVSKGRWPGGSSASLLAIRHLLMDAASIRLHMKGAVWGIGSVRIGRAYRRIECGNVEKALSEEVLTKHVGETSSEAQEGSPESAQGVTATSSLEAVQSTEVSTPDHTEATH